MKLNDINLNERYQHITENSCEVILKQAAYHVEDFLFLIPDTHQYEFLNLIYCSSLQ